MIRPCITATSLGVRLKLPGMADDLVLMDLGVAGSASDGVHIASSAGVWSSLIFGFGGQHGH